MQQKLRSAFATLAVVGAVSLTGCKPAETAEEPATVTEVSVHAGQVQRATLHTYVEAYGSVEPEPAGGGQPAGKARLAAPVAGVVLAIPAKEGERVEAGAVVVKLDDRLALANLAFAEQQFERQKKLLALEGASEKTFQEASQQLAAARAQLAFLQLTTPITGTVASIAVQPGQVVDMNTVVAEIVDLDRLIVTVNIPTDETTSLKVGQPAVFFTNGNEDSPTPGKVYFISPQIDPKTGTTLVRLTIAAGAGFRPGQLVRARIVTEERTDRLVVPVASVVTDVEGHSVIAVVTGDTAKQQPVMIGVRDRGLVEVEGGGLKEGDMVVAAGAYGLPEQTKVKIIND
jgi:membrane fusion protein (multidrug efflux system)